MEATTAKIRVNGIDLFHEVTGHGDPPERPMRVRAMFLRSTT